MLADPTTGALTDLGGGSWRFVPAGAFVGGVGFSYSVSDGQGGIVSKTFNITVIAPVVSSIVRVGGAAATGCDGYG